MLKCDHCSLEVAGIKAVIDEINGVKRVFCCNGCRGVFRFISSEGLADFYGRRESSWTPGPPDESPIEFSAFSDSLRPAGAEMEIDVVIDGIRCASCIWLIEKLLLRTGGVNYARVNYATHKAKLRWDPKTTDVSGVLKRIKALGYTPKPSLPGTREEELKAEQRDLLVRFGTAAFFSMQLMLYSVALYAGYFQGIGEKTRLAFQLIALALATPIMFYSGNPFIRGAVRGLKNLSFNMDVLIATGAGSAYLYSIYQIFAGGEVYFDTSAMIITLILLGRYIESGAKGRSSEVITRLLSLNPKEAKVIRRNNEPGTQSTDIHHTLEKENNELPDKEFKLMPISSIKVGDYIQITPGERIPLDGIVTEGASEVDESMLTGESNPVAKGRGSEIFCGTQNLYGSLIFNVKRTGKDTVLSKIITTVENAQARRAPVQALTDRVVGYFVPAVLLLSIITCIVWLVYGRTLEEAVMNAVSVLVIACPCALGLATPLAVLIGTTRGASMGILIKGGDIIERAKRIDTVVLDKTGTITQGRPRLLICKGIGVSDDEALALASSLERSSEHSIAKAIINAVTETTSYAVTDFIAHPGLGVSGKIRGRPVMVGSRAFIQKEMSPDKVDSTIGPVLLSRIKSQELSGSTVIYLLHDGSLTGIFVVSDEIRSEARESVEAMKKTGYDVFMITGDSQETAFSVADSAGIRHDRVMARKSPTEKAEAIKAMQERGRAVMMVGDGINDAPALVQADVGMAMGRATDIALESADMVLMRGCLVLVPDAVKLSKKVYRIIRQNLFWAFIYNIVAVPLAVIGLLHPIVAAVSMTLSSLCVVGNSVRLKRG
ncbi:MAG: heavy metal translocating P-type ATPase [Nitrospiraceae bacterium]|nr:MAG: heavy metal translocating P-type ATPase [Nitrospiraceae bacterium]